MDNPPRAERGGAYAAAETIARAAAGAWYRSHGPHHAEAMIGTVAALALDASAAPRPGPEYREHVAVSCSVDVGAWLSTVWAAAWIVRPDLISVAAPLYRWLEGSPAPEVLAAAADTAQAAIDAGVLQFGARMRHDADLLDFLVQEVHSHQAQKAGGVYHSPPEIGALMARLALDGDLPQPGSRFADECAGTGELVRATAALLRELQIDPASMQWFLNDRDPVAAACAAVGAMLWDLGPRVTIGCADILAQPDWPRVAAREAAAARAHRDSLVALARGFVPLVRLVRGDVPQTAAAG